MDLRAALMSGKKFRRKGLGWAWCFIQDGEHRKRDRWSDEDVVATDWEVEEKSVTITRKELADAYQAGTERFYRRYRNLGGTCFNPSFEDLAAELGL